MADTKTAAPVETTPVDPWGGIDEKVSELTVISKLPPWEQLSPTIRRMVTDSKHGQTYVLPLPAERHDQFRRDLKDACLINPAGRLNCRVVLRPSEGKVQFNIFPYLKRTYKGA